MDDGFFLSKTTCRDIEINKVSGSKLKPMYYIITISDASQFIQQQQLQSYCISLKIPKLCLLSPWS